MRPTTPPGVREAPRRLSQDPERCFRRRIAAGLTQLELAHRSGLSDATVCRIENGSVVASPKTLAALADALACDVTDLMPAEQDKAAS